MSSQKRAAADGECREESLLQETATKEAAMATRMEEVQAELKQARLALGNAHAEIDRLGVVSTQLKKVWCRWYTCMMVLYCKSTWHISSWAQMISWVASFTVSS